MRAVYPISVCFLFLTLHASFIYSQHLPRLQSAIRSLDQDPDMRSSNWGICVLDAQSGKVLVSHNQHRNLATASTMKALSTATALAVMGPDFRFRTELQYDGTLENGILDGNLYIRGDGDPTLGSDRFGEKLETSELMIIWADIIKRAGIREIRGHIIGDASIFSSQLTPGKWSWEDMGNYYGAGASGLNLNENKYRLDFQPGSLQGQATRIIRTVPDIPFLRFHNEVTTGAPRSGDNAYIFGSPYTFERYVRGTIPPGGSVFSIKGSIPDPALYCAQRLHQELAKCGISVSGQASSMQRHEEAGIRTYGRRTSFFTHRSPILSEIVKETNMHSINLYAEALLMRAAVAQGKEGSTSSGIDVLESYWSARGVSSKGMYLRDGSGLSSNNMISTFQMASIMAKAWQSPYGPSFVNSLPVAGRSGTLKSMLRGTAAEGRLMAKSGFISGVRAYTGYVKRDDGQVLAFSVIANHFSCSAGAMRRKLEVLMARMAE